MSLWQMRCLKRSFHDTVYLVKNQPSYSDIILKKYTVRGSTETLMNRLFLLQSWNSKYLLKYHRAQQVENVLIVKRLLSG